MTRIKIGDDRWVRCGNCNHKLFRILSYENSFDIEIKCHSCRTINTSRVTYYFTFGQGQAHEGHYVKVIAPNSDIARDTMIEKFGRAWAFQYNEDEWRAFEEKANDADFPIETELCTIACEL